MYKDSITSSLFAFVALHYITAHRAGQTWRNWKKN